MTPLLLLLSASASDPCSMEAISVYVQGGWSPAQVKEICPDFGSAGSQVQREVVNVPPSEPLCPTLQSGDADLVRNILVSLSVELTHDTKILRSKATVEVTDQEGGSNTTAATGERREVLYTAPSGWIITGLDSPASATSSHTDDNRSALNQHAMEGDFFAEVTSMGETEHSGDLEACDDSHAWVRYTLGPVIVVLEKE